MKEQNFTIVFNVSEMQIINDALMQMPYYKAAPVVNMINRQISEQMSKKQSLEGEPTEEATV